MYCGLDVINLLPEFPTLSQSITSFGAHLQKSWRVCPPCQEGICELIDTALIQLYQFSLSIKLSFRVMGLSAAVGIRDPGEGSIGNPSLIILTLNLQDLGFLSDSLLEGLCGRVSSYFLFFQLTSEKHNYPLGSLHTEKHQHNCCFFPV